MRLAVFASGRGSNFRALLEASRAGRLPQAEFVVLVSDKPDAKALDIARAGGVRPTLYTYP
jgi:phosphoribosylglycinamide formyltransferase-1